MDKKDCASDLNTIGDKFSELILFSLINELGIEKIKNFIMNYNKNVNDFNGAYEQNIFSAIKNIIDKIGQYALLSIIFNNNVKNNKFNAPENINISTGDKSDNVIIKKSCLLDDPELCEKCNIRKSYEFKSNKKNIGRKRERNSEDILEIKDNGNLNINTNKIYEKCKGLKTERKISKPYNFTEYFILDQISKIKKKNFIKNSIGIFDDEKNNNENKKSNKKGNKKFKGKKEK